LARSASIASTPRCLLVLSGSDQPSTSASTRPRTRISRANLCLSETTVHPPPRAINPRVAGALLATPAAAKCRFPLQARLLDYPLWPRYVRLYALRVLDPFDIRIAQLLHQLGNAASTASLSMPWPTLKIPATKSTFSCDIARAVSRSGGGGDGPNAAWSNLYER
jgi:hypothetical protein